jgi:hypothetical protein
MSPPLVPILSQTDRIHITHSYLSKIHCNTVHSSTSWSSKCSLFARSVSYETPLYAVFSNLPSLRLCSQTPSVYVPPLMLETKFRTHTKPEYSIQISSSSSDVKKLPCVEPQCTHHHTDGNRGNVTAINKIRTQSTLERS